MCTPVPLVRAGVVSSALLEAAAEAVEDTLLAASAYKGVLKTLSNTFQARFKVNNRYLHLGTFDKAEEAARAFDAHARSQGDKALNFPNVEAGEVQAVKGERSKTTLKRAAGGAASSAPQKRAVSAAGAASAPSFAAPPPAKQSPKAPGVKTAPRPPPLFRGPPSVVPQQLHPPPPPQPQPQQQPVQQQLQSTLPLPTSSPPPSSVQPQPLLPPLPPRPPPQQQPGQSQPQPQPQPLPPPPAPRPPQPSVRGHAVRPPGASPEEAFIASLSMADPAGVLCRMRTKNITLSHLVDAMQPGVADDMRQELWRDLFAELGVVDVGERIAMRFALARMQQ